MQTRQALAADKAAIIDVLLDTQLFPANMLDDMIEPFLNHPENRDHWFVHEEPGHGVVGFGYLRLEPLTEGTWNLLAIAVRTQLQGEGIGRSMMAYVEDLLSSESVLIVETSGTDEFAATREFYLKCGYIREATIRDYWARGDDKIVFWKRISD